MIVTEIEAAEKWCPLVQVSATNSFTASNRGDKAASVACIGSKCMAWQWHKTNCKVADLSDEDRKLRPTMVADGIGADDFLTAWRTYGYCGAFGKVAS